MGDLAHNDGFRDFAGLASCHEDSYIHKYWTSLDMSIPKNRVKVWSMIRCASSDFDVLVERGPVTMEHVLLHMTRLADKDGEHRIVPAVHVITPSGDSYCVTSQYAVEDLISFFEYYGKPPYSEEVIIKAVTRKTKNGHIMNRIEVVVQS